MLAGPRLARASSHLSPLVGHRSLSHSQWGDPCFALLFVFPSPEEPTAAALEAAGSDG